MNQAKEIISLLNDNSFPRVVLIDGGWGMGKTYFVKNSLLEELKIEFNEPVHFFSLYSVSSMDDFRDKIISLCLTKNEDASKAVKFFNTALDGFTKAVGSDGIGAVVNSAAGAYKYNIYSSLNNVVIVLDDLERVGDDNLIKMILGECLNLSENRNIKIVAIANESKLNCNDDIEKVFSNKYKFNYSHEEIVNILIDSFELPDIRSELLINISSINSKNIRVLKRAIQKFNHIFDIIKDAENIKLKESISFLLSTIIKICYAKFECGFDAKEIIGSVNTRLIRAMDRQASGKKEDNPRYDELDRIFNDGRHSLDENLVKFCCDGIYGFDDIVSELNLPLKGDLLHAMISLPNQASLNDEEFETGLGLMRDYITQSNDVEFITWFLVCDMYCYMIKSNIINPKYLFEQDIIRNCENIDVTIFSVQSNYARDVQSQFYNKEISELYLIKLTELNDIVVKNENAELFDLFKSGWFNVKEQFASKYQHSPIFRYMDISIFDKAFKSWSMEELFDFSMFFRSRYNFVNISDYFIDELDILKNISKLIDDKSRGPYCFGRRYFYLNIIKTDIDAICLRLTK